VVAVMLVFSSRAHVTRAVPQSNNRLQAVMFVAKRRQAGRTEQKKPARRRFEAQPAGGQHAQEMPAREQEHIAVDRTNALDHGIRARTDLSRRFASRAAVAKQLPIGPLLTDLNAAAAFILAVVPFD